MFNRKKSFSYKEQKKQRHKFIKMFFVFLVLYVLYNLLITFYVSAWVLDNNTMQPGFNAGDRLIFTSFRMPVGNNLSQEQLPFRRGSIVLVDMDSLRDRPVMLRLLDGVVRFFTFQRVTIFSGEGQYYIKRVIGLPGDEIFMTNYVFRIMPSGSQFSLTEFELSHRPYHLIIPQVTTLWDESIPFSGSIEPFVLGANEVFVVSDDRSNTNDSRTWGPVPLSNITARALFRFWPVTRFDIF